MAYKKAKSLKFPGLPDTYTIPQVADGASGNAAILDGNGNVGDSGIPAAKIAQVDGSYSQMNVGTSDNLVDKTGTGTPQEIVFRPTAGTRSIEKASAEIKSIYGKTLVWNQLVENGNFESITGWTASGCVSTVNNNELTTTFSNSSYSHTRTNISLSIGHKYLVLETAKSNGSICFFSVDFNSGSLTNVRVENTEYEEKSIFVTAASDSGIIYATRSNVSGAVMNAKNVISIDLTRMFGSGNEPSTVDEFRALFPLPYYAHDAGSLLNFTGTGIKTVGFNQWDEEYVDDGYFNNNGNWTSGNYISTKNPIKVISGATYSLRNDSNADIYITYWKAAVPSESTPDSSLFILRRKATNTIDIPMDCHYIHFNCGASYGTVYNHDICINLSWSGYRNGEYEPYWAETKNLPIATYFPDGMKSAGTVRDELTRDKAVRRCGTRAYQTGDEGDASVVTDGTNTVYTLSEPVETPIDPPLNFVYRVDDFGTEQLLPENGDEPTTTPLNASIYYGINYVREVENLPENYQSQDSMDSLLAALATATGGTFTKVWDSSAGKYVFTFTPAGLESNGGEEV